MDYRHIVILSAAAMAGYDRDNMSSAENTLMTLTNRFTNVIRTAPEGRTMGHEPRAEPPDDFVYVPCSRSAGLCLDGPLLGTPWTNASLNA